MQNIDNPRTLDLSSRGRSPAAGCRNRGARGWSTPVPKVLVDEKSLWPDGKFPTTVLIVRTEYLQEHPQTVEALLRAEQKSIDFANGDQAQAKTVTNDAIKQ